MTDSERKVPHELLDEAVERGRQHTRAGYIAGLRKLADLLEQHAEIPLPHYGVAQVALAIYAHPSTTLNPTATVTAFAAELSGPVETVDPEKPHPLGYQVTGWLHGLKVSLSTDVAAVCHATTVWRSAWRTPLGTEITAQGQDVTPPASRPADNASGGA